jgi:Tfp pilus assembly protein PilN
MPKKIASINVNLLPKDPFFDTPLGKTLKWALSVGRYIVIFTELVVIISFATRFSLDRQVTNLNDAINQKEAIIRSYGDLEADVRNTQSIIEQYQQIQQQSNIADVFPALSRITPQDVRLDELIIRPTSVLLGGTTLSQASLNLLITNIQLSPDFRNVVIDKIETSDGQRNTGYSFRLHADTRGEVVRLQATPRPATTPTPEVEL